MRAASATEAAASVGRRAVVKLLGVGGASVLAARQQVLAEPRNLEASPLLLHNNENPVGPSNAVLKAVRSALGQGGPAGRYPFGRVRDLHQALAKSLGVAPESVVAGCGSTQLLRAAVQMLTSPARPLVAGAPSYEECGAYARLIGTPVRTVPVDGAMKLDLPAMAEATVGAGLVFLDNPGNPTGTVLSSDAVDSFVERVLAVSPNATILIDEAYHDYVADPTYRSQVLAAAKNPRLVVVRTFSKAHGMAGLRVGYAVSHPDTIQRLASWEGAYSLNVPGIVAAIASIQDPAQIEKERARNAEAQRYTLDWFAKAGFKGTDSQTNFVFVNVGRPASEFRAACRALGVVVARDFPPFEKTHVRISIGTLEEMRRAVDVFAKVLRT